MLLNTHYIGDFGSELAVPAPIRRLGEVSELYDDNFTLVFEYPLGKEDVINRYQRTTKEKYKQMVNKAVVNSDLIVELTGSPKRAILENWSFVLRKVDEANAYMKSRFMNGGRRTRSMICYPGNTLEENRFEMFSLYTPGSQTVLSIFKRYIDTGVYDLWLGEFLGFSHSLRVQDRQKIRGKTTILIEENFEDRLHETNRKLMSLIYIWMICIIICVAVAIFEYTGTFYKFIV